MALMDVLPNTLQNIASHFDVVNVRLNREKRSMRIALAADRVITEAELDAIRSGFSKVFHGITLQLFISYPQLAGDVLRDPQHFSAMLIDGLTEEFPGIRPWMRNSRWSFNGSKLEICLENATAMQYAQYSQLEKGLCSNLKSLFGIDATVAFSCPENEKREAVMLEQLGKHIETQIEEQMAHSEQKKPCSVGNGNDSNIYGALIRDTPVKMVDIEREEGVRITIRGAVITAESRDINSGAGKILTFVLSDYSSSVTVKLFLRQHKGKALHENPDSPEQNEKSKDTSFERIIDSVTVGAFLTVRGVLRMDNYSHDYVLMANDINRAEAPKREDLAEEKRVELHMHTQMSSMDGVSTATALIKQAAEWGHPAVAITDHGVGQAFPEAFAAAHKYGIRFIPGMEGYLIDDVDIVKNPGKAMINDDIVVIDFETTGLNCMHDRVIEIGAVRLHKGQVLDELSVLIDPETAISSKITELTGITQAMVAGQPKFCDVADDLLRFIGEAPLAAHNADFDSGFLKEELNRCDRDWDGPIIDTLALARKAYPTLKSHRLGSVCKHVGVNLKNAHRAVHDARATAQILWAMLKLAMGNDARTLSDLNTAFSGGAIGESYHIVLLAVTQDGLTNLNRLISEGHLNYFRTKPHLPRMLLQKYREGIIVGSACAAGELFQALLDGKDDKTLGKIARFYDYLEIQPIANNNYLLRESRVENEEALRDLNRKIVEIGEHCGIPVVATGDVHFLNPEDAACRSIIMAGIGFKDADDQPPLYFKSTDEMLKEFSYLGEKKCYEVVVENPRKIADRLGEVRLFPKHPENKETFQPFWPEAADDIKNRSWAMAHERYGETLPEIVEARLNKELKSIIGYGFATLYSIAQKLVAKSLSDGYLVGSRGSVGSSFVATMCGITEVNPLPPHYRCPNCRWSYFDIHHEIASVGPDLPDKECPNCGSKCLKEGFDIPFEVFLGFKGDKVPDIDLNFSGVYRPTAAKYVETLFGEGNVFRAGTIGTLAEKTAYGFVRKYFEERNKQVPEAEMNRLAAGCVGIKRTTGQHPGGIVVLPKDYSIYQFTAIQKPANDMTSPIITTHYEFASMHDVLVKLDLLGHDDPTMINMLERFTGINARSLPLTDPKVMSLFKSPEALGVTSEQICCTTGTYGIPEFGTSFVRGMLDDTQPSTMEELIRISGLSHGTDVWLGNAADLITNGTATLKECICTRDDIMNYLIMRGVDSKIAFETMESVRKGRGLKPEMEKAMNESSVPSWFIDSCKKIKYMFPKGHAVAYVTMALRVAWFKVYRPAAYYASYYTVRADAFDIMVMSKPEKELREILMDFEQRKNELTAAEKDQQILIEIALEMNCRGIHLLPLDLYESSAEEFKLKDGSILPPFNAIPGLGLTAAESLVESRKDGPFLSIEDFKARTHLAGTTIEQLKLIGLLDGLAETSQVTMF